MNERFSEWRGNQDRYTNAYMHSTICWHQFNELPFEYQWGVYLEFFDSTGLILVSCCGTDSGFWFNIRNDNTKKWQPTPYALTRNEAQQAAVKKAFEILD